jgi:hypothetical protein
VTLIKRGKLRIGQQHNRERHAARLGGVGYPASIGWRGA